MTMDELMEYVLREMPDAIFGEEDAQSGEIYISTGLKIAAESDELEKVGD
jgi:hypothetical protein